MKKVWLQHIRAAIGSTFLLTASLAGAQEFVPGEYVVSLQSGVKISGAIQALGGEFQVKEVLSDSALLVKGSQEFTLQRSRPRSGIRSIEPNYIYRTSAQSSDSEPNDPSFTKQWALKNVKILGADVSAPLAWARTVGSHEVVVSVVDTGIDYNHQDLKGNMWVRPGTNAVHGIDALTGREDPMDGGQVSHGTHCAGIIGAVGGNRVGVTGVNWNVSLMGAKFMDAQGRGTLAAAIKAINYSVENGARVINASWGGSGYSRALEDAIRQAGERGVLFVAAAGNNGTNNDSEATYPARFALDNVIAVAATGSDDGLVYFSNYGQSVLLAAPGSKILSTLAGNQYGELSGTSMAAPHVTGAAALLLSVEPHLSVSELKERLTRAVDVLPSLQGRIKTGGRLNLSKLWL